MIVHLDFETFSSEPIQKVGAFKYVESPDFEIILCAYSADHGPVISLDLTTPEGNEAFNTTVKALLLAEDTTVVAYNAIFEALCIMRHFKIQGTPEFLGRFRCTMLHGQYCGLPAGLGAVGAAMGLPQDKQKDSVGKSLITYFCKPCKPTKTNGRRTRNLPHHDPEKWALFIDYNRQDVVAEMEIERRLSGFPVPEDVQRQWVLDQRINLRGVAVDLDLVDAALAMDAVNSDMLVREAQQISGLENPNSVAQLRRWLEKELDEEVADLRKDTVSDLLGRDLPNEDATRILEIRRDLGKASNKKYVAMAAAAGADGRLRGMMQFYGANRTGREAGRIVQPQNLPHDTVDHEELARELVKSRDRGAVQWAYGSVPHTLSALIRTALVAAPGCVFVDADFSAIEARVIAWLAGEKWVLDVFRTHGKIYEATASQMFGIPMDLIKKGNPEYAYRAKGKVATLALGYQGGTNALINMGALRSGIPEEELPEIVERWRQSNPAIKNFWYKVEAAAQQAVCEGRRTVVPLTGGQVLVFAREIDWANGLNSNGLDFMTIQLPSGRKLYYANPHMGQNRFGNPSLCYWGQNGTSKKWAVTETYGGKLSENITQAVARDCLFYAMENLTAAGYRVVFDVHDEVVLEVPEDKADLADVVRIMSQSPPWAPDLPLNADGWVNPFFHKD